MHGRARWWPRSCRRMGHHEAALTYTNNDYGKGLADSISANVEMRGGTITISAPHEDGKGDYSAEVTALDSGAFDQFLSPRRHDRRQPGGSDRRRPQRFESGRCSASTVPARPGSKRCSTRRQGFVSESYVADVLILLAKAAGSMDSGAFKNHVMAVANAPGEKIYPGELAQAGLARSRSPGHRAVLDQVACGVVHIVRAPPVQHHHILIDNPRLALALQRPADMDPMYFARHQVPATGSGARADPLASTPTHELPSRECLPTARKIGVGAHGLRDSRPAIRNWELRNTVRLAYRLDAGTPGSRRFAGANAGAGAFLVFGGASCLQRSRSRCAVATKPARRVPWRRSR